VSRTWRVAMAVAFVLGSLVFAGVAGARTYKAYTCSIGDHYSPLGPTIGGPDAPSGWFPASSGLTAIAINDRCPSGGGFTFQVVGLTMTAGQNIEARWTAPADTRLVGLSATWSAESDLSPGRGQGTGQLTVATDQQMLLAQNTPLAVWYGIMGAPRFAPSILPAKWFEVRFTCLDQCATMSVETFRGRVFQAEFDVEDFWTPVGGLTGGATDAQTWSRVMHFGLNGADVGGGLFQAIVEVDGTDALPIPLGGSTCRDLAPDPSINGFPAAQPCLLRIDNGTLDIDTSKLPQGQHVVRVLLEDAAGNRTAIFGPVTRTITSSEAIGPGSDPALRGAANGDGASDLARLTAHWGRRGSRTLLVSRFGRRHVVRGRLRTAEGAPIATAAIDMVSKTTAVNARELAKRGGPRTGADGTWRLVLPRGVSSRDVTFRYRSHVNDTIAAATARVRLRVRAGLHLAIHPRRARQGQAIHFDGRLLGGPLPRGGKQVVLLARASRGGWVRFNVVRTDGGGRFRTDYRFRQAGAALYRFRALSLSEAAYPYLAGGSNVVKVRKA
jgi:hypothetical protein